MIAIQAKSCEIGASQTYAQRKDAEKIKTRWVHYNLGADSAHVFYHDHKGGWRKGDRRKGEENEQLKMSGISKDVGFATQGTTANSWHTTI